MRVVKSVPAKEDTLRFAGPPKDAADALKRIGQALHAYRNARKRWPESLDELVSSGLITREATSNFRDPKSGAAFMYSIPQTNKPDEPVVFSTKYRLCPWVLQADGKVLSTQSNP